MRKIIFAILSLFILTGCATKTKIEYVDREVVKYETKVQHDTLINNVHDSIYHTIFQKGDTIYDTKYVERTKYRDRIVYQNDTCWRDSVATEYKETVKEVVKIPKIYRVALLISILSIIFAILKLTKWLKIR